MYREGQPKSLPGLSCETRRRVGIFAMICGTSTADFKFRGVLIRVKVARATLD